MGEARRWAKCWRCVWREDGEGLSAEEREASREGMGVQAERLGCRKQPRRGLPRGMRSGACPPLSAPVPPPPDAPE
eukprot:674265-Rhodomonas_salina.2